MKSSFLAERGDVPAIVMAESGEAVSYRELEERSVRLARLLRSSNVTPGQRLAVLLENHPRYFEVCWAGLRSGLHVTPINRHLRADEIAYIVNDCDASALVTSGKFGHQIAALTPHLGNVGTRLMIGDQASGFDNYETAVAPYLPEAPTGETEGALMFYSSGTTGRPKGIRRALAHIPFGSSVPPLAERMVRRYGFSSSSVYLCPAPLYHAAPLSWSTAVHRIGGTVVVMERFDPEWALELIARYRVTHAQFVPTHFVRMLKLDPSVRSSFDLSSLEVVVHAAAPCPVEVKEEMMRWWGPIIHEYYAGSEANGTCAIRPEEWQAHKGSVGKPLSGVVHILDDRGDELPAGAAGEIWFDAGVTFEYHKDPEKTRTAFNAQGWSTLGDIGYLDPDGYLYLTDRASHMIISGGVNIYPQEVENVLALHPAVYDVAVIGVPDPEMGEQVKAVVQPSAAHAPGEGLEQTLLAYCRDRLATYKCPKSVDFVDELPRLPTGKLRKRDLRLRYWPTQTA